MNALRSLISVCMVFEMLFGSKEYLVSEPEDFMEDASLSRAALNPGAGCRIGNKEGKK